MAEGIRAPNLPLGTTLGEFIGHEIVGTTRSVRRFPRASVIGPIEAVTTSFQAGGGVIFTTKAQANSKLAYGESTMAWVILDTTPENNGVYQKSGASGSGSWVKLAELPYSFYRAVNEGVGTANAIQATNGYPMASEDALIVVNITATTTASPVTLSLNGGTPLTVKTASGNDPAAGGLLAGMVMAGYIEGANFRLLSDQASAAIVPAAEAAQAAAQAAQAAAENVLVYTRVAQKFTTSGAGPYDMGTGNTIGSTNNIDIKIGGVLQDHDTYTVSGTTFTLLTDPGSGLPMEAVLTSNSRSINTPADGSVGVGQLDPTLVPKLLPGDELYVRQFGAVGDDSTDDTTALTNFINAAAAAEEADAILSNGTYRVTTPLPNFLNPFGTFKGRGRATIKYTGAAALPYLMNLSDPLQNRFEQRIKNITLQGNAVCETLLYMDKVNHALLEDITLRDCHPGFPAAFLRFCVLGDFRRIFCSGAGNPFSISTPLHGLILGEGTASTTQFICNYLEQLIIENVGGTGVALANAWYNHFNTGTSESNGGWGVSIGAASHQNKFTNFFCEDNGIGDFTIQGDGNELDHCEGTSAGSQPSLLIGGQRNIIRGGRYRDITINPAAGRTRLENVSLLGTLTNNGVGTYMRGVYNETTATYYTDTP